MPLTPEAQKPHDSDASAAAPPRMLNFTSHSYAHVRTAWRCMGAEFTATFLFVYLGLGSAVACGLSPDSRINSTSTILTIALSNGLALSASIAVGTSRGVGHCNPALTCAYLIARRIGFIRAVSLICAQVSAALSAATIVRFAFPASLSPMKPYDWAPEKAFLLETVSGGLLAMSTLSLRAKKGVHNPAVPVVLGFLLTANMVALSSFADGTVNPARSLAISVILSRWAGSLVHILASFVGASFGALLHMMLFESDDE